MRIIWAVLFLCLSILYADVPTFNYSGYIDRIEQALEKKNYSLAQDYLTELLEDITQIQNDHLLEFFPETFEGFVEVNEKRPFDEDSHLNIDHGFNKVYTNDANAILDISLIHQDPAIMQYTGLVNNPKLVAGLESMEIVTVQDSFAAIKKMSQDSPIIEFNIVLSEDILLNIVSSGMEIEQLTSFISLIDLNGIVSYLKP